MQSLRIDVVQVPATQRVLEGEGNADVVNGLLIEPIGVKYPYLGFIRWLNYDGSVVGSEITYEFSKATFYPPSSNVAGFEIWIRAHVWLDVTITNGGGSTMFEDYYTKGEVNALLAAKANDSETYSMAEVEALLSAKANSSDTYTKAQIDARSPASSSGFSYDQITTPVNPANGQTWRERDANDGIVQDWFYSAAYSAWLSSTLRQIGISLQGANQSNGVDFVGNSGYKNYHIRLDSLEMSAFVSDAGSEENYWTYYVGSNGGNGEYSDRRNTKALGAYSLVRISQALTAYVPSDDSQSFKLVLLKTGNPGSIYLQQTLYYRYQRP
jgi:hypothetical protein